jgi:hypothetical protein
MGDEAEDVYQAVTPLGNTTRFGFRRPKGIRFSTFPENLRHQPDFVTSTYLVEVMGLGRDGILKSMKVSKYDALKVWNKIATMLGLMGLVIFVWNSSKKQFLTLTWSSIVEEVAYSKRKYGIQSFESDGNTYYRLDWGRLVKKATFVGTYEETD